MTLTLDDTIRPTNWAAALGPVDDSLFRMWGIHAGRISPRSGGQSTFSYPSSVAAWLYAMWGISVPVADAD